MEWSVSEDPRRFRVKAQHSDGRVFVNSVLEGDREVLEQGHSRAGGQAGQGHRGDRRL